MLVFLILGGGGTALATDWYVVSGDTGNQIKFFKATTTSYDINNWSSADSSTNTSTDINTFLSDTAVESGDTVYIKEGTYKLSTEIKLDKVLHLYGGFAGTETTLSDRNSNTGTILDANANSSNQRSVFNISTNSTIDGFTITGGYVSRNEGGGGIYISSGTQIITNCTIRDNTVNNGVGGGFCIKNGTATITNCTIIGNSITGNNARGGGISVGIGNDTTSLPTITMTNCTITGNTAANDGGGICIKRGTATIINCTIVKNTMTTNDEGHEIYFQGGTSTLYNTLIWNAATGNAIAKLASANPTINYYNCAYPGATGDNNIILSAWDNPVSSDVTVNGVTHKVYKISDNYSALQGIIGQGSNDIAPEYDQIRNAFANPPSIGAVEIIFSFDITGTDTINAKHGMETTETFTPIVSLDNEALASSDYTISWDVTVSDTNISIDQSGKLTVGSATPAGTYEATVKAQVTYGTITSNVAEKKVTITVESGDMTLTLTSKDLPNGKVNTAYTEAEYFTATVDPTTAALAWNAEGLPEGLSFNEGKISGTPTASGNFSVKVTVTATLANYNTTSKDITASITIDAADEPTPTPDPEPEQEQSEQEQTEQTEQEEQNGQNGGGVPAVDSKDEEPQTEGPTKTEYIDVDIKSLTLTQRAQVTTITFTDLSNFEDLIQNINSFSSLTTVKISADVVVSNGTIDLSALPANIKDFSISGNTSLKALNLKGCKIANIDASNCQELESVDVSGNTSIVTLNVSRTKIKLLDVSKCSSLTTLDCSNGGRLRKLNIEGCNALKIVKCSHNSLLIFDIPAEITSLTSVDCAGQSLNDWTPALSFNFDDFVQSYDIVSSTDNTVSAANIVKASEFTKVKNLKAYDSNNNEITVTTDDNGNITFASMPDRMTYDYDIGFNNQVMDVTVNSANSSYTIGNSGSGCNMNLGALSLMLIALVMFKKIH